MNLLSNEMSEVFVEGYAGNEEINCFGVDVRSF